jgi:hypothetical protein
MLKVAMNSVFDYRSEPDMHGTYLLIREQESFSEQMLTHELTGA